MLGFTDLAHQPSFLERRASQRTLPDPDGHRIVKNG
jgi:hypothetical protein